MAVKPPPRQESTSDNRQYAGKFPLVWIKWLDSIRNATNLGNVGGISAPAITENITLGTTDSTILCDASGGIFTVTLPDVSTFSGFKYNIKKIDTSANDVTISGGGANVEKLAEQTLTGTARPAITIHSDGTEWWII